MPEARNSRGVQILVTSIGSELVRRQSLTITQIMILLHYYVMGTDHPEMFEGAAAWRLDISTLLELGLVMVSTDRRL